MRLLLALEYLFEHEIIRCDLKPTGIMVDQDLNPVILDLGIAKRLNEAGDGSDLLPGTRAGVAIGTPAYAAPEQLSGKEVDVRSDIFAVAAILVEMVSGRAPRGQGDLFQVLKRALNEDIDVEELPVSDELRAVLRTALERDPERRYPTPAAMNDALSSTPEGKAVAERVLAQPSA
jgi:serine/threonine-protein kinase